MRTVARRKGLVHKYAGLSEEAFFQLIDETGGWPIGYAFVGFDHSDERDAGFTNDPTNDGWWTVLNSADDYYLWKLSPNALQKVVDAALNAARITQVDASKLWIKNSRGYRLTVQKEKAP